jgi:hypothetical protein
LLTSRALARKTVSSAAIARNGAVPSAMKIMLPNLVAKLLASGYLGEDPVGAVGEFRCAAAF